MIAACSRSGTLSGVTPGHLKTGFQERLCKIKLDLLHGPVWNRKEQASREPLSRTLKTLTSLENINDILNRRIDLDRSVDAIPEIVNRFDLPLRCPLQ